MKLQSEINREQSTPRTGLSTTRRLLAQALECSQDAVFICDASRTAYPIVYSNPALERLTGYSAKEIVGQQCDFLHGCDTDVTTRRCIRDALKAGNRFNGEILQYRQDGTTFWSLLRITPLCDTSGRITHFTAVQTDITGYKQNQIALRESEQRFSSMANTAPVLMWMSGTDKGCIFFNAQWLDFTGRSLQQELGNGWAEGVHPDDISRCLDIYTKAFDERRDFSMEYRLRHRNGEYRWIFDRGTPRYAVGGAFFGYIGACIDITERVKAETALRNSENNFSRVLARIQETQWALERSQDQAKHLSRRLLSAQEEERRKIARELHDDLTQRLAVLAIDAGKLQKVTCSRPAEGATALENITQKLVKLSEDVHTISRQIHPSILDDLGLAEAVKSECDYFQRQEGIDVVLCIEAGLHVQNNDVEICLYRVLQEALRNVAKHARTESVWVSLKRGEGKVVLCVKDNGVGFSASEARQRIGLGLCSMEERLRIVAGQLRIETKPGRGALIEAQVPLENPR